MNIFFNNNITFSFWWKKSNNNYKFEYGRRRDKKKQRAHLAVKTKQYDLFYGLLPRFTWCYAYLLFQRLEDKEKFDIASVKPGSWRQLSMFMLKFYFFLNSSCYLGIVHTWHYGIRGSMILWRQYPSLSGKKRVEGEREGAI